MVAPRLSELVIKYKRRANLSFAQVGKKSDLPSRTIQSWAKEYSKHPRHWQGLVQFADAVALNPLEVDELLQVAGHATLENLQQRGERSAPVETVGVKEACLSNSPDGGCQFPW